MMHQKIMHARALTLTLLGLLTLAGCTTSQFGQTEGETSARSAQRLSDEGDHQAAAAAWLELAIGASGSERQRYLILSANERYLANDLEAADRVLAEAGTKIANSNLELWAVVTAELRLAQDDPAAALAALNQVTTTTSQSSAERILLLRAEALFDQGRPETAVATLLQREAILTRQQDIDNNHRAIWSGLQRTGDRLPPDAATRTTGDPVLNGWLDVGYVAYQNRATLTGLSTALSEWQATHPDHPASGTLLSDVLANLRSLADYPDRVAVLLPLSGPQRAVGEAIRDGFLAAHFALGSDSQRPRARFYDTERSGVAAAYQQAVLNGSDFIIGPLLKPEVEELAGVVNGVATLALNYGSDSHSYPERFYQFALAPEDEAREVARRAIADGQYNAVALVPDSTWGQRVLEAFTAELDQLGGRVIASRAYDDDSSDYADVIRDVLLLDESYARRQRLAANTGLDLEFTPRRRQDVDLIFIAANANKAKLLRPQLRFHYASDIPTYATSAIYKPGSTDNADINGVLFPDMPWLLAPTPKVGYDKAVIQNYWGKGSEQLARLYAMGYDAYHLSAMLNADRTKRSLQMSGMTGELYLDDAGRIHRQLTWAKMERGKPRTLPGQAGNLIQDSGFTIY